MVWLSRKELERRVLNEKGRINLDASLAELSAYVDSKKTGNRNGFEQATCNSLREGEKITIRDAVEQINKYGIGRFGIGKGYRNLPNMGVKRAEDLCRVLRNYGIIKGKVKRYSYSYYYFESPD